MPYSTFVALQEPEHLVMTRSVPRQTESTEHHIHGHWLNPAVLHQVKHQEYALYSPQTSKG